MAEYIKKEDILKLLEKNSITKKITLADGISIYDSVKNASTADAVEVVRCKDCDVPHNKWLGCPNLNGLIPPPDFYCSKGTPKQRGGEKWRT